MQASLEIFLDSEYDGFYFLGHASALLKIGKELILCDPIWEMPKEPKPYENFLFYPHQVIATEILSRITACVVSHEHADHWSPSILKKLKCPVHIMDGRPRLRDRLGSHAEIIERPAKKWSPLVGDVSVFFVPNPKNTVDSSCLIRGKDLCIYAGSDNFLDRNLCQVVATATKHVDVACIPYACVFYYPHLLEMDESKKKEEAIRLKKHSLDEARMFIDIVRPGIAVPFGNNLFYCEGPNHPLNAYLAKPSELWGALPLAGGDYVLKRGSSLVPFLFPVEFLNEWEALPPMAFSVELSDKELTSIMSRVRKAPGVIPWHAIRVNDVVTIDAHSRRVYEGLAESIVRDRKLHYFWFDSSVFHAWASGKITFEGALGSRRFKYSRNPDEFNPSLADWWANHL